MTLDKNSLKIAWATAKWFKDFAVHTAMENDDVKELCKEVKDAIKEYTPQKQPKP
jgi:hypothetical protein